MRTDECCGSCKYLQTDGEYLFCGNEIAEDWFETVSWEHSCIDWKSEDE